ncbi:MAG: hypothetical protein J6U56_01220 [Spirochaetia bacterium]|nr:hypothetical protein [Spirochaetia bacterium]
MKVLNKKLILLLALSVLISGSLFAASDDDEEDDRDTYVESYSLGDQMFYINGGVFIPLFFFDKSGEVMETNLTLGGTGSLCWQVFLSNHVSLGAELGGMFALSPNKRVLYMIPLTIKASYWFRFYPFEIPISLGLGGNLSMLDEAAHIDFIAKPSVGFYWNFNEEWAFGANATYWFVPQIYSGSGKVSSSHSMFGNFMDVTLSVLFRF